MHAATVPLFLRRSLSFSLSPSPSLSLKKKHTRTGASGWSNMAIFTTGVPTTPNGVMLLNRTARSLSIAWQGEPALRSCFKLLFKYNFLILFNRPF